MTSTRQNLVALIAPTAAALALSAPAHAADSRAGATRAGERHAIAYVKRYGVALRTSDVDLQCSAAGRSRWKCFVYTNGGQCTGTLTELYSARAHSNRARDVDIGCGE